MEPIEIIKWFDEELKITNAFPTAVCLSTNGAGNYPNAGFIYNKDILQKSL